MVNFHELLKGNIYFFYRPKLENQEVHSLDDVQRFFMILKPGNSKKYILIVIGVKHLPENEKARFCFVKTVTEDIDKLIKEFNEQVYSTNTQGKRNLPEVRCLGEGKFIIVDHNQHSHFIYSLMKPETLGNVQKDFFLKYQDDFLITVKNPNRPSPKNVGLTQEQKASYSKELIEEFNDYNFISLIPVDFIYYEGAEFLLIRKEETDKISNEEILKCLEKIPEEDFMKKLEQILDSKSISPVIDMSWA